MALHCEIHEAFLYDRGGVLRLGSLGKLDRVKWGRVRDDVSDASVRISARSAECDRLLGLASAGRTELVIYRGGSRVWEGPVTHIAYERNRVEISAKDVFFHVQRTNMTLEYDNSYPNVDFSANRAYRILRNELVRKEAQNPPINVRKHIVLHQRAGDARTTSRTLPNQMSVFEHIDALAARGGLDYTVVGRAIHLWDTHMGLGRTATVTEDDFIGGTVITEYGMELATVATVTDGRGRAGITGGADPYYGLIEVIDTAYDESSGEDWDEEPGSEPPTVAEMRSQAQRILAGRNPTPVVVRVPENSTLNPRGVLSIDDLVPGVHVPLQAELPGRSLSQLQKLDNMNVEETKDGESITITLSPAPNPNSNAEDGA